VSLWDRPAGRPAGQINKAAIDSAAAWPEEEHERHVRRGRPEPFREPRARGLVGEIKREKRKEDEGELARRAAARGGTWRARRRDPAGDRRGGGGEEPAGARYGERRCRRG